MRINKKIMGLTLALSFAFILSLNANNTSYAASTNSAFYRSSKTRSAYLGLTESQRVELDSMNTDGKWPLTIEEVLDTGRYSLPIVKGRDWLYPFMLDRNKDGQVGENYFKGNNNGSSRKTTEEVEEAIPSETEKGNVTENEIKEDRAKIKADLEESVVNAKIQIDACENIMENYPKTIEKVKDKLLALLAETKEYIKTAEELLETL